LEKKGTAVPLQAWSGPEGSRKLKYRYSSPVTGLEWPRGFQEFKVPRFNENGTGW